MSEMLNYFYTLILISCQEWAVLAIIQQQHDKLTDATFGSWIKLRDFLCGKKQMKQIRHNSNSYTRCKSFNMMMENEICEYELFSKIFHLMNIENQNLNKPKKEIKLSSSFEIMRDFRNSTRGHGIYTYEITDELNLFLIEIMECWFHKLNKNGFLDENYANLEQLGWVLKYRENTYYFYSYNERTNELEYHCFLNGTALYMPYDFIE